MKMITRTSTVAVPATTSYCNTLTTSTEEDCQQLQQQHQLQPHRFPQQLQHHNHHRIQHRNRYQQRRAKRQQFTKKYLTATPTLTVIMIGAYLLLMQTIAAAATAVGVPANGQPSLLPQAAALASPDPGVGSGGLSGTSSILEQFSPNCTAVSHLFQLRGINAAEIPTKPSNEMVLRYCESPTVGTCCTYTMETKLAMQSRAQLEEHTKHQIVKMSSLLTAKSLKFNEVFRKLLLESKEEFHNMFTRTYGVIYQQNSYVFSDLFNELENYYARGRVDLIEVMDKFFNTLYQKMFQVLNAQYSFDEKYLRCVSEHMKELKPFGDVPDKLSVQIKRSFVATRTYGQALATAADVSKKLVNIRFNADCTAALTKMQHCGACKGYAEKPCTNYCVNVIKGCLHHFHELDVEWENFAMAMDKVAERLLGSFNIVMVVEPINIKISEAIMNFQDAGQDIKNRVFQGCGRPSLGRSRRNVSPKFTPTATATATAISNSPDASIVRQHITLEAAPVVVASQAEQIESDILDIDALLDDAIVLREKRVAEPGSRMVNVGNGNGNVGVAYNSEEQTGSTRSGITNGNGNGNVNGNGNGNGNGNNGGGGTSAASGSNGNGNNQRRNQRRKQQQNRKNDDIDYNGRDPVLDKLVRDIRQRVKDFKKFWSNLPHQICSNDDISSSSDADGMCWNGHTIDRYMHSVTTEHGRNPEFPGNPTTPRQTAQVATQLYYLKNAISHLRNAYNGQDVDWSDQEEPFYGSGSGSGGGSDDEDDDEGSGLGGNVFTPSHKPEHTDHPSVRINNIDDEDAEDVEEPIVTHTSRPKYTGSGIGGTAGGTSHETNVLGENDDNDGSHDGDNDDDGLNQKSSGNGGSAKPPQMSLRRALLLYMLPLYMAWFGGLCAELL